MNIGIIGFGTVGSGVYERLLNSRAELQSIFQQNIHIKKVFVKNERKQQDEVNVTNDPTEFFQHDYDVVFEAIGGIQPAKKYIETLIQSGTSIITANKELIAKHGKELEQLANTHGVYLGYEAAVGGGIPIVNSFKTLLATTPISSVSGILNGTTNYILTEMKEKSRSFDEVLAEAQLLGYAESDPTADVEGYDALYKVIILSRLAFNSWPKEDQFSCKGISAIEPEALQFAEHNGLAIKLIAKTSIENGKVSGFVSPSFVSPTHPLYHINGVTNGICLDGQTIDRVMMSGPGAGKQATANSMVEDFVLHEQFQNLKGRVQSSSTEESLENRVVVFASEYDNNEVLSKLKVISNRIEILDNMDGVYPFVVDLVKEVSIDELERSLQKSSYPLLTELSVNKIALPS